MTVARRFQDHWLPRPKVIVTDHDEDWKPLGSCRSSDPDAWFPSGEKNNLDLQRAIAVCRSCPVQVQCLDYALAHNERHGVWGGVFMEDPIQRRRLMSPTRID